MDMVDVAAAAAGNDDDDNIDVIFVLAVVAEAGGQNACDAEGGAA